MSQGPDLEKYLVFDNQKISLDEFASDGLILDIGGGGEGVIGQLKGNQVISIDKNKRELEEAKSSNLKIVMDATNLHFLDNSFETVAAFFSFMYFPPDVKEKAMQEIYRVLKPGGKFLFWDVTIPPKTATDQKDFFAVILEVTLPNTTFGTGYGVRRNPQDYKYFIDLAKQNNLENTKHIEYDKLFFLEFRKK